MQAQRTVTSPSLDAQIVWGIMEFGPRNLRKLSELLKIPYPKVASTYRRIRRRLALQICAAPNTELLGLRHAFFEARPSRKYRSIAPRAFEEISSLNYLAVNANRPTDLFGVIYLPLGPRGEHYLALFDMLAEKGFLEWYDVKIFPESNRFSVRPECVDWRTGKYSFSWDELTPRRPEPKAFDPSIRPQADRVDLLLLKELELDATQSFPEIAVQLSKKNGVKLSDRVLLYHYVNHLVPRKMFSKYRVAFSQSGKLGVYILAQTSPAKLEEYLDWVRRIPYLTMELVDRSGSHFSEHYLPSEDYTGFLGYVGSKLAPLVDSLKIYCSLPGMRAAFTLPFELFDEERGEWVHDPERDVEKVLAAAKAVEA